MNLVNGVPSEVVLKPTCFLLLSAQTVVLLPQVKLLLLPKWSGDFEESRRMKRLPRGYSYQITFVILSLVLSDIRLVNACISCVKAQKNQPPSEKSYAFSPCKVGYSLQYIYVCTK